MQGWGERGRWRGCDAGEEMRFVWEEDAGRRTGNPSRFKVFVEFVFGLAVY